MVIDLSKNEHPYGPPAKCLDVLKEVTIDELSRYSRDSPQALNTYFMRKYKLAEDEIILGYGGEDILIHILEQTVTSNDKVLLAKQSWPYFTKMIVQRKATPIYFNLSKEKQTYVFDIPEILATTQQQQPKLLIISSPNNPTGNSISKKDLLVLLKNYKGLLILDEAYANYATKDEMLPLIKKYKNLIIDGRGHLLGRLASVVAKQILNGQRVVSSYFFFLKKK